MTFQELPIYSSFNPMWGFSALLVKVDSSHARFCKIQGDFSINTIVRIQPHKAVKPQML